MLTIIRACLKSMFLLGLLLFSHLSYSINGGQFDSTVRQFLKEKPVKAMIYGLWVDGKPVSINAIGDSMTNVPASTVMRYRIGGITETMLTAILMRLVEDNKLSLDDPVSNWYPNLPNAKKVTLKMLANCTSGYPDYVYNQKFIDAVLFDPFKSWTASDLIDYAMMDPVKFQPGKDQYYSHTDYVILGDILTKATRKSMQELLKLYIFDKVGLTHSQFSLNAEMSSPSLHAFSEDRKVYEDSTYWDPSWTSYSGAVVSNIYDLGKWANAWMKQGLLTEASIKTLRAPDTVGLGKNTPDAYFAMGFVVVNHWLIQNPSFGGYSGVFAVLPEKNIVFIAVNTVSKTGSSDNTNYSVDLFKYLSSQLAPEYPVP